MANQTSGEVGGHPAMDYPAHEKTYAGFIKGATWCTLSLIAILVLMALFLL